MTSKPSHAYPNKLAKSIIKALVGSILTSAGILQDAYQGFFMITFYKHYSWYNNNCCAKENCQSTKQRKTRKGIW